MVPTSENFSFLSTHAPHLVRLGTLAERYFKDDPNTCIVKLRQFGEVMAQMTAAKLGVYTEDDSRQFAVLARLRDDAGIAKGVLDLFHQLRRSRRLESGSEVTQCSSSSTQDIFTAVSPTVIVGGNFSLKKVRLVTYGCASIRTSGGRLFV